MLKRAFGVKGAVFALYAFGFGFAALGVAASFGRARLVYALILIFASYIGVTAIKLARRKNLEAEMLAASSLPPGIPSSTRSPASRCRSASSAVNTTRPTAAPGEAGNPVAITRSA